MLSFTSSLRANSEAFAIFVTEKYDYKDKKNILPDNSVKKINSFLSVLKAKKKDEDVSSFDISGKQKCFIIRIKNKFESYWPQESGGNFFSYLKKFKDIKKIDLYPDSLDFDKQKPYDKFIIKAHDKYGIPIELTQDCHYCYKEDSHYQRLMLMIQGNKTVDDVRKAEISPD